MVGQSKTFPLIANAETSFPFVVYQRTSAKVNYTKDGRYQNILAVEITIICDNYPESIDLLCLVRNILEGKRYKDEEIWIRDIRVDEVSEDFNEDTFIQRISFDIDAI